MKDSLVLMILENRATTRMGMTGRQIVSQYIILATAVTHYEGPELLNSLLTGQPSVWDAAFFFRKVTTWPEKTVSNDQPFTQCGLYVRHAMLSPTMPFYTSSHNTPPERLLLISFYR